MMMGSVVLFMFCLLLFLDHHQAVCGHVVRSCDGLKRTIEQAAKRNSGPVGGVLALELVSDAVYYCVERIHVASSQTLLISGGIGSTSVIMLSLDLEWQQAGMLSMKMDKKSAARSLELFVNEGTLQLENVVFHLPGEKGEGTEADDACGRACLVQNSGHLKVVDIAFVGGLSSTGVSFCVAQQGGENSVRASCEDKTNTCRLFLFVFFHGFVKCGASRQNYCFVQHSSTLVELY